jgi:hypothetical protein
MGRMQQAAPRRAYLVDGRRRRCAWVSALDGLQRSALGLL